MVSQDEPARLPALPLALPSPAIEGSIAYESGQVLVVDEDREHALKVGGELEAMGLEVDIVTRPELALEHIDERIYDLVISELCRGDVSGCDILEAARRREHPVEVVIVTGRGNPGAAVQAMNRGALTYLTKPVNMPELRAVVRRALERLDLERRTVELERRLDDRFGFAAIVGTSPAMQQVFERLRQVAPTNATVLITGETGTGKELVAKSIHQNSPRARHPFVPVNCAALPETIAESELFGHEKGAFTGAIQQRKGRFEAAHKGTLFLDEVGDMPMPMQVRLLRVLEEREIVRVGSNLPIRVDVRLIAATNATLEERVAAGTFREDLYYRLKVVTIALPPLRERTSDIPLLTDRFVREFSREVGKEVDGITPEARRMLTAHAWKGNVRELRSAIEHMVVVSTTPILDVPDLPPNLRDASHQARPIEGLAGMSLEDVERELIRNTLRLTGGNREQAAKMLGIGERTLYRKINKFNLR